jgi:uncharacterized RDD family membrane protein YckC
MSLPPPLPTVNPYAAPTARVIDPLEQDTQELADRGTRLLAAIVDVVIYFVVLVVAGAIGGLIMGATRNTSGVALIVALVVGLVAWIAVNWVLLHRHGQTIAKRLFKIKIVRSDGSRCSLLRVIFARWLPMTLLGLVPVAGPLISLLDPLLIFRDDYRCLHDLIADTVVVKA